MNIKTNNVSRPLLSYYDLTEKQQAELGEMELDQVESWKGFVFKGNVYSLDEFTILSECSEEKALGWDGASAQSAFHAVLVKLADKDFDSVVVGQVFC